MKHSVDKYRDTVVNRIADRMIAKHGVKIIDIDDALDSVEEGGGTYIDLLNAYEKGRISLLRSDGAFVGISYNPKVRNRVKYALAQLRFQKAYEGVDVLGYIDSIVQAKLAGKKIDAIVEEPMFPSIHIAYTDGTVETISKPIQTGSYSDCTPYYPIDDEGEDPEKS